MWRMQEKKGLRGADKAGLGDTIRSSVLQMLCSRCLSGIQMEMSWFSYTSLWLGKETCAGDTNIGVSNLWMVFKATASINHLRNWVCTVKKVRTEPWSTPTFRKWEWGRASEGDRGESQLREEKNPQEAETASQQVETGFSGDKVMGHVRICIKSGQVRDGEQHTWLFGDLSKHYFRGMVGVEAWLKWIPEKSRE